MPYDHRLYNFDDFFGPQRFKAFCFVLGPVLVYSIVVWGLRQYFGVHFAAAPSEIEIFYAEFALHLASLWRGRTEPALGLVSLGRTLCQLRDGMIRVWAHGHGLRCSTRAITVTTTAT